MASGGREEVILFCLGLLPALSGLLALPPMLELTYRLVRKPRTPRQVDAQRDAMFGTALGAPAFMVDSAIYLWLFWLMSEKNGWPWL